MLIKFPSEDLLKRMLINFPSEDSQIEKVKKIIKYCLEFECKPTIGQLVASMEKILY